MVKKMARKKVFLLLLFRKLKFEENFLARVTELVNTNGVSPIDCKTRSMFDHV